jgi:hypothetical protein
MSATWRTHFARWRKAAAIFKDLGHFWALSSHIRCQGEVFLALLGGWDECPPATPDNMKIIHAVRLSGDHQGEIAPEPYIRQHFQFFFHSEYLECSKDGNRRLAWFGPTRGECHSLSWTSLNHPRCPPEYSISFSSLE